MTNKLGSKKKTECTQFRLLGALPQSLCSIGLSAHAHGERYSEGSSPRILQIHPQEPRQACPPPHPAPPPPLQNPTPILKGLLDHMGKSHAIGWTFHHVCLPTGILLGPGMRLSPPSPFRPQFTTPKITQPGYESGDSGESANRNIRLHLHMWWW